MTSNLYAALLVESKDIVYEGLIGRGSFAEVYKGMWQGKKVALKCIRITRMMHNSILPQEVEILRYLIIVQLHDHYTKYYHIYRKLNHPNIISLLGYSFSEEELILITNYVKGSNLDTMLFGKKAVKVYLGLCFINVYMMILLFILKVD